jgi:hypothetical protein
MPLLSTKMRNVFIALVVGIVVAGFKQPPLAENFKENSCAHIYTFASSNIPGESERIAQSFYDGATKIAFFASHIEKGYSWPLASSSPAFLVAAK